MITWQLDLQLSVQSVPASSNPIHGEAYSIQHYVIKFAMICGRSVVFPGFSGFLHQ
jgi:hypothetical protein